MDSIIINTFGKIENGKVLIFDNELLKNRVNATQNCGIELIIKKRQGTLSHQMRKYYFGSLLKELQKAFFAAGHEYGLDEIDHTFRMKALYKEEFSEEKGMYVREPHTLRDNETEVTTSMMSYYFEYIIRFASQNLDWSIAFPNEIMTAKDLTDNQAKELLKR